MNVTPYETIICQHYKSQIEKTRKEIIRADISYPLPALETPMGNKIKHAFVVTPADEYGDIEAFTQPLNIGDAQKPKWVIDGRPFMRWDKTNGSYRLTASNDYAFQCYRVALLVAPSVGQPLTSHAFGIIPAKAFTRWIGLTLTHRYNLSLDVQIRINVFAAYYYLLRFMDETTDVSYLHRLAGKVTQIVGVPTPQVIMIIEEVGMVQSVQDFIGAISQHSGSVRLEKMKYVDLFTLLATSWVGVNSRENVGVALEDPATLLAMLFCAVDDRSFRKTVITKRMETAGRPTDLKDFVDQTYRFLRSAYL